MGRIALILLIVVVKGTVGYIMTCPALDDYSDSADENIAWLCNVITWSNKMAKWKGQIEKYCSVRDVQRYWRSSFRCPDFYRVKCVNRAAYHTEIDSLNCRITFCTDGQYQDEKILRRIWRQHLASHDKLMDIYADKLVNCRPRDCNEETSTTSSPGDEYTQQPITTYPPYSTHSRTPRETTTDDSSKDDISTTPTPCYQVITEDSKHSGPVFDDCRTNTSGGCLWIELHAPWSVSFEEGERICAEYGSVLAVIPDEQTYRDIRDSMLQNSSYEVVWTGATMDPTTKQVCPLNAFAEYWYSTAPYSQSMETKIAFIANSDNYYEDRPSYYEPALVFEGFINYDPREYSTAGVVCWKPKAGNHKAITPSPPYSEANRETTTTVSASEEPITTPAPLTCNETITEESKHSGPVSDDCKTNTSGGCLWIDIRESFSVTFEQGERICAENGSVLAVIPDEETYRAIRESIVNIMSYAWVWTGATIDPITQQVCPLNAFKEYWWSGAPYYEPTLTKIVFVANTDDSYNYESTHYDRLIVFEGYSNRSPDAEINGVVCWKPKASI